MTDEETTKVMAAEVKTHFAPKQPAPKEPIDPKVVQHFVDFLERPPPHVEDRPSDYERCIKKTYAEKKQLKRSSMFVNVHIYCFTTE
jgi:hypothetical protein